MASLDTPPIAYTIYHSPRTVSIYNDSCLSHIFLSDGGERSIAQIAQDTGLIAQPVMKLIGGHVYYSQLYNAPRKEYEELIDAVLGKHSSGSLPPIEPIQVVVKIDKRPVGGSMYESVSLLYPPSVKEAVEAITEKKQANDKVAGRGPQVLYEGPFEMPFPKSIPLSVPAPWNSLPYFTNPTMWVLRLLEQCKEENTPSGCELFELWEKVIPRLAALPSGKEKGILSAKDLKSCRSVAWERGAEGGNVWVLFNRKTCGDRSLRGAYKTMTLCYDAKREAVSASLGISPVVSKGPKRNSWRVSTSIMRETDREKEIYRLGIDYIFPLLADISYPDHRGIGTKTRLFFPLSDGNLRDLQGLLACLKENYLQFVLATLDVSLQLAEGLLALKEKGFAHCDLKPSNVLIILDGRSIKIRLTDFGSAICCGRKEKIWELITTCSYAPPEIADCYISTGGFGSCDPYALDVWSLGMIWYELLNGRPKVHLKSAKGEEAESYYRRTLQEIRDLPSRWFKEEMTRCANPPQYEPLWSLIDTMLARNPKERPPLEEIIKKIKEHRADLNAI